MTGLAPAAILWLLTIVGLAAAFSPPLRRPEPGVSALGSSEDEDDDAAWTDGDGTVRVPGEDVREGWL